MKLKTVGSIGYLLKTEEYNFYDCNWIEFRDKKNEAHREDGPAIMWCDGWKEWRQLGMLHRTEGPAIIHNRNMPDEYWINGEAATKEDIKEINNET